MFGFPSFPLLSNRLELSCGILRRCSGGVALDYEQLDDSALSIERLADGTFVARWVEDDEIRSDGISRDRIPRRAGLRIVESPSRPWRAGCAAMTATVVLFAWLFVLRAVLALRSKVNAPLSGRTEVPSSPRRS
jgi:hypothetical protein